MAYSVQIRRSGSTVYTFAAPTPFVSGRRELEHDTFEVPRITGIFVRWSVECVIRGSETTLPGLWTAFKAAIETPTTAPDGIRLVQGSGPSAVVVDSVAKEDGFYEWKIEAVELDRAKDLKQWRSEIRFTLQVSGRKRFVSVVIGAIANLANLTETKTWGYNEAGLASITLAGELEVTTGSAVATARLLAQAQLPLPGLAWRYETAGPEGTDVEQLDLGDRKASFRSTIRELGLPAPSNVGPGFSVTVTEEIVDGEQTLTTTVEAEGPGASDAVNKYRPSGVHYEKTSDNQFTRRSSGVFVEKAIPDARSSLRFDVLGGGQDLLWHPRTGGLTPAKHVSPFGIVTIKEEFTVEAYGQPAAEKFNVPPSLADGKVIFQIGSGTSMSPPVLVTRGVSVDSDRYAQTFRRTYNATSFASAASAIFKAVLADSAARGVQAKSVMEAAAEPDEGVAGG